MPSFFDRIASATRALMGREERSAFPGYTSTSSLLGYSPEVNPAASVSAYGDNPWLYSALTKIADQAARVPFGLRTKVKQPGDPIEYVTEHQALDALRLPQPVAGGKSLLSGYDLRFITILHLCLAGDAYWILRDRLKPKYGGGPTRIDVALPQHMTPKFDDGGNLVAYLYRNLAREVSYSPADVVHFKLPNPAAPHRGHNPVSSIRYALDTHLETDKLNLTRIRRGGVPPGFLKFDQSLTAPQMQEMREQFERIYGGAANAGRVAVLPNKGDFQEAAQSAADMQYQEGKKANRDEILANFAVGPEILGMTDSQTRANAEAAFFAFMKFGVSPFVWKYFDTLNTDFLVTYPSVEDKEFYFEDPVPENAEEKRANALALWNAAGLTPDEYRKMFGLEPLNIPGVTDVPYLSYSMVPVGSVTEEPPPLD